MSYFKLSLKLSAADVPHAESILNLAGGYALSLDDAAEAPLFEPGVGETPLWPEVSLSALFDSKVDTGALVALMQSSFGTNANIQTSKITDQDWHRGLQQNVTEIRIADNLTIVPANNSAEPMPPSVVTRDPSQTIKLNMGLAFGTGHHPTTVLCLQWLAANPSTGGIAYDLGCGSGILALAAIKFGADHAFAADTDPQALTATQRNALINDLDAAITIASPEELINLQVDLLMANILSGTLIDYAQTISTATRPGGKILLSGILKDQVDDVITAFQSTFVDFSTAEHDDWCRIVATRRTTPKP